MKRECPTCGGYLHAVKDGDASYLECSAGCGYSTACRACKGDCYVETFYGETGWARETCSRCGGNGGRA